jgi:hypothetical protein
MINITEEIKASNQVEKSFLPGAPWPIMHKSSLKANTPELRKICGIDYVFWKDSRDNISFYQIFAHTGELNYTLVK